MKICSSCKSIKELSEFNKNIWKKDGLHSLCRDCSRAHSNNYYKTHKKKHIEYVSSASRAQRKRTQQLVLDILKNSKCLDCGTDDYRVFEFDHVRGLKLNNVSSMISGGYGIKKILEEISKCEVVCANCHRIRTFERAGNYRSHTRIAQSGSATP